MTMPPRPQAAQRVSRSGLELIKSFEGLRRKAARLPGGRFVVGYGHIRGAREGAEVAPEDAEALLRYDLLAVEAAINDWAMAPLTQNQFDALASFAFNIGLSSFRRSDVLRRINEGDLLRAAAGMDTWRRVDLDGEPVIVDALVRRRAVEKALFLTPPQGQVPAPTGVLKPRIDAEALSSVLLRRPEEVQTPFDGDEVVVLRTEPEFEMEPEAGDAPSEPEFDLVVTETVILTVESEADVPDERGLEDEPDLTDFETEADLDPAFEVELVAAELEVALEAAELEARIGAELDAMLQSQPEFEPEPEPEFESEPEFEPAAELTDDEPDESWSTAQAAAAAVAARLSEILSQDLDHDEEDGAGEESSLTLDPYPEAADGDFLQAPPSPPDEDEDQAPAGFPERDDADVLAFAAETQGDMASESEPAKLAPFHDHAELPPVIEPEEQAEFDSAFADDVETPGGEQWGQNSGALPSQGDPGALSQPLEGNNRAGMLMALTLAGMTFIIAGLVSFATSTPGAEAEGAGWTIALGLVGVILICTAAWIALAPPEADDADTPQQP